MYIFSGSQENKDLMMKAEVHFIFLLRLDHSSKAKPDIGDLFVTPEKS